MSVSWDPYSRPIPVEKRDCSCIRVLSRAGRHRGGVPGLVSGPVRRGEADGGDINMDYPPKRWP